MNDVLRSNLSGRVTAHPGVARSWAFYPGAMSRWGHQRRPARRRHLHAVPEPREHLGAAEDQELFQQLRGALHSPEPLDLLGLVSGMVEATDPRSRDPFRPGDEQPERDLLIESLIGTPCAETTAALTVLRELLDDPEELDPIAAELGRRPQPMPRWLAQLPDAYGSLNAWFVFHALGDETSYLVDVEFVGGRAVSALVTVEHNLGSVVTEARFVPLRTDPVADILRPRLDGDTTVAPTDAADARAVLEAAVDRGRTVYPQPESPMWPVGRPLLTWMLRLLPDGGEPRARIAWTRAEKKHLAEDFFASPFGRPLDDARHRALLDSVIRFGTEAGPGEPTRWSPTSVAMLMEDWFPRTVSGRPDQLAELPELLRAFVRHCHERTRIRAGLTELTVSVIDELEPEYQRTIRSPHPRGPEALIAELLDDAAADERRRRELEDAVGGAEALRNLDAEPLPDEDFDWQGIADDVRPVVEQCLDACDRCADELLDVEHRTAMRRFLRRVALAGPGVFRRRASPVRSAAAVAWVICRANETVGTYQGPPFVADLLGAFGVTGSVSQRAEPMLRAIGVARQLAGSMNLGTVDLLTSQRRRAIIRRRDGGW